MAKGAWRRDPIYQMREDNADPRMRPSVDHLVYQLRKHKALVNHPDAVGFVIKDLSHRFFVRDDQRPDLIWEAMRDLMFHFEHLMPPAGPDGFDWVEEKMDTDSNEVTVLPQDHVQKFQELAKDAVFGLTPAGDSPEVVSAGRVVMFDNQFMKDGIAGVIVRHRGFEYTYGKMRCACQKFFSSPEEWAKHVRIRIWRFFKNEFPPIPSDETDRELHTGETGEGGNPDTNGNQPIPVPVQLEEPTEA